VVLPASQTDCFPTIDLDDSSDESMNGWLAGWLAGEVVVVMVVVVKGCRGCT